MLQRETTKKIVGFVAQYGSGIVIGSTIKALVPTPRIDQKIAVAVASFMIGGVVAKAAKTYSDGIVDDIYNMFTKTEEN